MSERSLRWKLVRYLVILQVSASVLVLVGFVAIYWVLGRFVDESGETTAGIIGSAIRKSPDGQLILSEDEDTNWLLSSSPKLWFIARSANGQELRFGDVPQRYVNVLDVLDGIERASLDLADPNARPAARFQRIHTVNGSINLIVKTGAPFSIKNKILVWMLMFLFLVAPTVFVTSLVVVLATPFVVRRGLRGLMTAVNEAHNIDIESLGNRLSTTNVPTEIRPLVDAVNKALSRLHDGYRRQSRFLGDAAHELRTPITTLRLQADSLPDSNHKTQLIRSTTRLMNLSEQLLDLQRLKHSNALEHKVDLRVICEKVAADLAPLAILCDCSIEVDAPHSVVIKGDAFSLERAVSNLIQNAIDHGGEGCIIEIMLLMPAIIIVNDSGVGIPEKERERVIEPFYRLKASGSGTGLGLHLVAEVARMHDGDLIVGKSPAGGASMQLFLKRNHID